MLALLALRSAAAAAAAVPALPANYLAEHSKTVNVLRYHPLMRSGNVLIASVSLSVSLKQWRRQDLLRGGAKLEIRSRGTHGELQGRVLLDD